MSCKLLNLFDIRNSLKCQFDFCPSESVLKEVLRTINIRRAQLAANCCSLRVCPVSSKSFNVLMSIERDSADFADPTVFINCCAISIEQRKASPAKCANEASLRTTMGHRTNQANRNDSVNLTVLLLRYHQQLICCTTSSGCADSSTHVITEHLSTTLRIQDG